MMRIYTRGEKTAVINVTGEHPTVATQTLDGRTVITFSSPRAEDVQDRVSNWVAHLINEGWQACSPSL